MASQRRQVRVVLGRRHLVGFQHRHAGQAELEARDSRRGRASTICASRRDAFQARR